MPVDTEEFLRGIAILADNNNMRVSLRQSGKGAAICGAVCFIGGLVGGPVGMAVGGAVGGVAAYKVTGHFRSVGDIIQNDLTMVQQELLKEHIVNSVRQIHPVDIAMLLPLLASTPSLQQAVLGTVTTFVTNELRYTLAN